MTKTNKGARKSKGGRPTDYKKEYEGLVYKLCLLGATDKEMADVIGVTEQTVNNWKNEHPAFFESIKSGKMYADANMASRLYARGMGYSHPDTVVTSYQGEITKTEVTKHYPPDTAAAFIWLKNRRSGQWRDKHDIDVNVNVSLESPEERKQRIAELLQAKRLESATEVPYEVVEDTDKDKG